MEVSQGEFDKVKKDWQELAEIELKKIERPLLLEEVRDPFRIVDEWVTQNQSGVRFIALGEAGHHGSGTLDFERELVEHLQNQGVSVDKVYLEEYRDYNRHLRNFYSTGRMPSELKNYLLNGFVRVDQKPNNYRLRFVETLYGLGIPCSFIRTEESEFNRWSRDTSRLMFEDINDDLTKWDWTVMDPSLKKPQGLYLIVTGRTHVLRTRIERFNGSSEDTLVSRLLKVNTGRGHVAYTQDERGRKTLIPWKVLTLNVSTFGVEDKHPYFLEYVLNRDLRELGMQDRRCGIMLKNSPYQGCMTQLTYRTKVGEALDIAVSVPGENLRKNAK